MQIGELSRRADVPIDTVRYYERNGLIPLPGRTASGYRDYLDADVQRLRFVRRAKRLGFTLQEIGELLGLTASVDGDMAGLHQRAQSKLRDVQLRIDELQRVRDALQSITDACPGHGALARCPILAALSEDLR